MAKRNAAEILAEVNGSSCAESESVKEKETYIKEFHEFYRKLDPKKQALINSLLLIIGLVGAQTEKEAAVLMSEILLQKNGFQHLPVVMQVLKTREEIEAIKHRKASLQVQYNAVLKEVLPLQIVLQQYIHWLLIP